MSNRSHGGCPDYSPGPGNIPGMVITSRLGIESFQDCVHGSPLSPPSWSYNEPLAQGSRQPRLQGPFSLSQAQLDCPTPPCPRIPWFGVPTRPFPLLDFPFLGTFTFSGFHSKANPRLVPGSWCGLHQVECSDNALESPFLRSASQLGFITPPGILGARGTTLSNTLHFLTWLIGVGIFPNGASIPLFGRQQTGLVQDIPWAGTNIRKFLRVPSYLLFQRKLGCAPTNPGSFNKGGCQRQPPLVFDAPVGEEHTSPRAPPGVIRPAWPKNILSPGAGATT